MNEIKKMQTPWDSDKILMVDIGCYERGCVCVANQWDANYQSECVPMVEYKEWVGLNGADWNDFNPLKSNDPHRVAEWVEKILKERNGF